MTVNNLCKIRGILHSCMDPTVMHHMYRRNAGHPRAGYMERHEIRYSLVI